MKKNSYELLDDGFLNLYEEGIFVRCFEYSAILLSQFTGYKLFVNIDKKLGFVFLECSFPKIKCDQIILNLEHKGYGVRYSKKNGELYSSSGNIKLPRNKQKLLELKNNLITF